MNYTLMSFDYVIDAELVCEFCSVLFTPVTGSDGKCPQA